MSSHESKNLTYHDTATHLAPSYYDLRSVCVRVQCIRNKLETRPRNESIFFFAFFFVHAFFDANAGADENYAQALKEFVQASVAAFDRGYSLQVGCV